MWKIVEGLVPNLSDRRGRTCIVCHSGAGRLDTLKYNSFKWLSIRMFNRLPKSIRMLSCSVVGFKSQLDSYLRNIVDLPCQPGRCHLKLLYSDAPNHPIFMRDMIQVLPLQSEALVHIGRKRLRTRPSKILHT